MHSITPNGKHAIVNLTIAFNSTSGAEIADGLNEILNTEVDSGFVADYAFAHVETPFIVKASADPEEGELFVTYGLYVVVITNEDGVTEMIQVESDHALDFMNNKQLRDTLSSLVAIAPRDSVTATRLDNMSRMILNAAQA